MTRGATYEANFRKVDEALQKYGISWGNTGINVGVDNTSVNLSKRKWVMTKVLEKNPAVVFDRFPCHIIINTACKGGEAYVRIAHFNVKDVWQTSTIGSETSTKRNIEVLLSYQSAVP